MGRAHEGRAVVVGGGIAGLLAARVLSEYHREVRILDRDALEPEHEHEQRSGDPDRPRRGVPQGRHIHALLPRGRQIMEELFPGLTEQSIDHGAPTGDLVGAARLHLSGHRFVRADADLATVSVSRPFLEARIRERVRALSNVTFGPPTHVLGLVTAPDGEQVRGVRVLRRADGSAEEMVEASLVIDAMGRGSRTPHWLTELGYAAPEEDRIASELGYATRHYELDSDVLGGDWGTFQGPTATLPRGGVLARIEGDRWIVTLFGLLGDHPPTDPDGFVQFARSLPFTDLEQAMSTGRPLDDPVAYRFPASVRRRYERLRRFPSGLLPIGDAVCSLNPTYGQGMTVAALQSLALREQVARVGAPAPRDWLRKIGRILDGPWDMAVGGDLAIPEVDGLRTTKVRVLGAYVARLHAAAAQDPRLAVAFARAMSLVDPPSALLRPSIAVRVLRGPRFEPRSGRTSIRKKRRDSTVGVASDEQVQR